MCAQTASELRGRSRGGCQEPGWKYQSGQRTGTELQRGQETIKFL